MVEVFPGTLLVHSGNTCSWTQVPCPPWGPSSWERGMVQSICCLHCKLYKDNWCVAEIHVQPQTHYQSTQTNQVPWQITTSHPTKNKTHNHI